MIRESRFRPRLVRGVRLAVVRSNVWPLGAVYRALYGAAARAVVRLLRVRFPAHVEAAFLRGSLAMDLLVPGLSDIDLFFVLSDTVTPEAHEEAQVFYRRLAAWCPVLDPHPWMLRWADVEKLYGENPGLRFRVLEGRQAFRRLYGRDRLAELPAPDPADTALAQLFDLKSRLTYFNAFCLTRTFTDELEARREEYLLFKLAVELARIALFLSTGAALFHRREILGRFLAAEPHGGQFLSLGGDRLLRSFVAHTARFRLRRSFRQSRGVALTALEETLLRRSLELLARFYARPEVRGCPLLVAEHEHFYGDGRFLPTGHPVRRVPQAGLGDYRALKRQVLDGRDAGVDTVLEYGDLLVNLSNADPRLGNCTVVALPTAVA